MFVFITKEAQSATHPCEPFLEVPLFDKPISFVDSHEDNSVQNSLLKILSIFGGVVGQLITWASIGCLDERKAIAMTKGIHREQESGVRNR